MVILAGILGDKPSAWGQTIALLITFIGIGIVVNLIIAYAVFSVLAEHKENRERQQEYDR